MYVYSKFNAVVNLEIWAQGCSRRTELFCLMAILLRSSAVPKGFPVLTCITFAQQL